jgi:nucleoporin NUP42
LWLQIQQASEAYNSAEQQIQNALSNLDGAIDYLIKSQNEHPNRLDTIRDSNAGPQTGVFSRDAVPQASNPFGSTSAPAFGAPSRPSAFGAPSQPGAFGAPSQPGAFGQPSAMGQKANPFGAPSAPAFRAPTQLGGTTAFGQSSALGQKPNPFGAPSAGGDSFGQPSGGFGPPSQPAANPFGVPSQIPSAFGAPSQLGPTPSAFGQPSGTPLGAPSAPANPFGGGQQQSTLAAANPFGQSAVASNPFGAPSPARPTPFGAPPTTTTTTTPFSQPSQPAVSNPFGSAPAVPNPFVAPSSAPVYPFGAPTTKPPSTTSPFKQVNGTTPSGYVPATGGDVTTYITKDMTGRLTVFKGRRVEYKHGEPGYTGLDGSWCRIFFPDGPPTHTTQTTTDVADQYDAATEAAYKRLLETGEFPNGEIPLLPPKKEWLRWDF